MIDNTSSRRNVGLLMMAMLLFVTMAPRSAFATMVSTDRAIEEQAAMVDRDALREQLSRDDVQAQLEQMGVSADRAIERVAAMTDTEIRSLSAGLGDIPAGADVGLGVALLLVVLVVVLVR